MPEKSSNAAMSGGMLRALSLLQVLYVSAAVVLALFLSAKSLGYRPQHDVPMVLYPGWLFLQGEVPYKDIFDVNFPGSFLLYGMIGAVTGLSDVGLRIADLVVLATLCWMGYRIMRHISQRAAICGCAAFALIYLGQNWWWLSLQREVFILLAVMAGATEVLKSEPDTGRRAPIILGVLASCCVLIKPQSLLPFMWLMVFSAKKGRFRWVDALAAFALPILGTLLYLSVSGALPYFVEMVRDYLPLYAQIGGNIVIMEPGDRIFSLVRGLAVISGMWPLVAGGVLAGLYARAYGGSSNSKRAMELMLGLAVCFWILPAFSGQFWLYHWLPLLFVSCLLLCVPLAPLLDNVKLQSVGAVLLSATVILLSFYVLKPAFSSATSAPGQPKAGRVDEMVDFLRSRLKPDDTIEPLDWTGGAVHAMLILRAKLPTRYMQDFYFYHHVSSPVIQRMRDEFVDGLERSQPRFVIQVLAEDKPWPSGRDTTREFPRLERFLSSSYMPVLEKPDFRILERR
jgi:hypothetical protein